MTVSITNQGNPINIAADSQTISVNVTSYDTSAAALTAASAAATSASQAALYDGPWLDDVAALLADTSLTYTAALPGTVVAGDYVQTRAEGFAYQVAASGAVDQHVTTAGGVKLYVRATDSVYEVLQFGMGASGTDISVYLQKALDACIAGGGGDVVLPAGDYTISTTINMNDFMSNAPTNIPVAMNNRLRLRGAGSGATRLMGGEIGFGFIEYIGANLLIFEGFSVVSNRTTNLPQYGLCGGRKTGNASSGTHTYRDVYVIGRFTKAAHYMMSSEINVFRDGLYYPQVGHGLVLAMNNIPWAVTPRYGTFGTGLGGNGDNQFENMQFMSASEAAATDLPFVLEYAQSFRMTSCYWATTNNTAQIMLRKACSGLFQNCFFEGYGSFDPYSIWFAGDDPSDPADYIDHRDINVSGGRLLRIRAEDDVRVTNMTIDNAVFRGVKAGTDWHIDMAKVYDSRIKYSNRLPNVTLATDLKVRARQEADNNVFEGINIGSISLPNPTLNQFAQTVTDDIADMTMPTETRMNTVPGAAVSVSGMYAQLAAGNVPGTAAFGLFVDFDCPTLVDGNVRAVIGLGGANNNLGGTNSLLIYTFNGNLFFRSMGPTGATENTYRMVDASFIQKLAGKRIRLLLVRNGLVPIVYINGHLCQVVQSVNSARLWTDTIAGPFVLMGFSSTGVASNCSTAYYQAALLNYAPTAAQGRAITRRGVLLADKWGGNFGGVQGCNGFWRPGLGRASVYDESGQAATGVITGTVTRSNPNSEIIQLFGSATYDPPSLADGAGATTTVTVTGAATGDYVDVSFSLDVQGITVTANVTAANTVTVRFQNETGGTLDLASGTLDARVIKR